MLHRSATYISKGAAFGSEPRLCIHYNKQSIWWFGHLAISAVWPWCCWLQDYLYQCSLITEAMWYASPMMLDVTCYAGVPLLWIAILLVSMLPAKAICIYQNKNWVSRESKVHFYLHCISGHWWNLPLALRLHERSKKPVFVIFKVQQSLLNILSEWPFPWWWRILLECTVVPEPWVYLWLLIPSL